MFYLLNPELCYCKFIISISKEQSKDIECKTTIPIQLQHNPQTLQICLNQISNHPEITSLHYNLLSELN